MKFLRSDLDQMENSIIKIDRMVEIELDNHPRCRELRNVHIFGEAYYDMYDARLTFDLSIEGEMIVPCAITFKPLILDFDNDFYESYTFIKHDEDEEDMNTFFVEGDEIDIEPNIRAAVLSEIPMKVVDPELEEYPKGDGWIVMTEEEYEKEKSEEIDPRLAKLKELNID